MLKYNLGVFNALYEARLPLVSVINGATINPAKYLGVDDKKGTIEVSKDADIIVVDDKFDIKEVFLKGSKFFN